MYFLIKYAGKWTVAISVGTEEGRSNVNVVLKYPGTNEGFFMAMRAINWLNGGMGAFPDASGKLTAQDIPTDKLLMKGLDISDD